MRPLNRFSVVARTAAGFYGEIIDAFSPRFLHNRTLSMLEKVSVVSVCPAFSEEIIIQVKISSDRA
jgi:hypothetical protein